LVIRVGPAGWSYPDWDGKVYPFSKPHGFHALSYLARYFDCIEVNSTFYAMPHREHAERWIQLVADRTAFRFTIKLNRDFTHAPMDSANDWDEKAHRFSLGIEPIVRAKRLMCLLVQFPISFLFGKSEVRRLGRLRALFSDVPLALEVRHNSWFTPPALDTLRGLSYSLAYIDLPAAWNHPPQWHTPTGAIGYLRLHGQNREQWFRHDADRNRKYDHLYTTAELAPLASKAQRLATVHDEVVVITNNHFEGKAVANAIELRALLEGEPVRAPPELIDAYPHLRAVARAEGQQRLF
jgi:uncharacterized protein YecE (DUF72 family)